MAKVYFHIDLNAFFANAEILLDPSLKGKPLVVSGNTRRSVVSTASYEARKFGIHSAMPLAEAEKLCRDLDLASSFFYKIRREDLAEYVIHLKPPVTKRIAEIMAEEIRQNAPGEDPE